MKDSSGFALIIANGLKCSQELLQKMSDKAKTIIVLDGAMHRFKSLGIVPHYLLGDFDRNELTFSEIVAQYPEIIIVETPDQNATDLEKGIHHAISLGYSHIEILWATGLRADHTVNNIFNLVRFPSSVSLYISDDHSRIFRCPNRFRKHYTAGAILSLTPVGIVSGIRTTNLKYELSDDTLELGFRNGSSNEVLTSGEVAIDYEVGHLLLMECWD